MAGVFLRSRDPMILNVDNLYVDIDYSNQAFHMLPSCNYPEAHVTGEIIIKNSWFYGTKEKQIPFQNDFLQYAGR